MIPKRYIGDGVYVEVERGMLRLTTDRTSDQNRDVNEIFLEPEVYEALAKFYDDAVDAARESREQGVTDGD